MSSTARFVQSAATRRAIINSTRFAPSSSRPSFSHLQSNFRNSQSQTTALAILLPHRLYSTETSHHGGSSGDFPPPGFNAKEAQKPLPKEAQVSSKEKLQSEIKAAAQDKRQPTAEDKTAASANATLSELAAEKAAAHKAEEAAVAEKKEENKKLTLGQKVKKEIQHYWDGTKLLATEVRISSKLAFKMAAGYELSRREHRQLKRTVQDLGRLVPFSVFVIVPFAELLLPVALKLFPNLLPSTYEGQSSREKKAAHLRATRKSVSGFLRNTLRESGLPISAINAKKEEFTEFFRKVRASGEQPTHEDVIKVCKIFKDDLTLDNLSRPQLVGMCKYMNLNTFGTDAMLRYQIRHRMRQIKRDDKAISYEGVDSLSVPELQMACASRGLRTHGMSPSKLREDLQMWLDLRLKFGVPSTLLVLSNAYMYTSAVGKDKEIESQIDALQAVLSSIPEELFHEIELEVHNAEGAATNKQRLEVLKEQQELIEEENEQDQKNAETSGGRTEKVKDTENIDPEEKPKKEAKEDNKEATSSDTTAAEAEKDSESSSAAGKEAKEAEEDITEQGKAERENPEKAKSK